MTEPRTRLNGGTVRHVPPMTDAQVGLRMNEVTSAGRALRDAERLALWALASWRWTEWVPTEMNPAHQCGTMHEVYQNMLDLRNRSSITAVWAIFAHERPTIEPATTIVHSILYASISLSEGLSIGSHLDSIERLIVQALGLGR